MVKQRGKSLKEFKRSKTVPSNRSHRKRLTSLPHRGTLRFYLDFEFAEVRNCISSVPGFMMAYGINSDMW